LPDAVVRAVHVGRAEARGGQEGEPRRRQIEGAAPGLAVAGEAVAAVDHCVLAVAGPRPPVPPTEVGAAARLVDALRPRRGVNGALTVVPAGRRRLLPDQDSTTPGQRRARDEEDEGQQEGQTDQHGSLS